MTRIASSVLAIVIGGFPEDATRRIAAADAEIHPAVADLVEHGQR
jgi:hypothetical protein